MELSVIIVSYNVRYFLEQCLRSVRKASENIDCEIFVVDNNSADGSCSMVSIEFPEVRLIMNNDNRGFSAANNQALKLAAGRYILLLNPDTIVEEDTFKKCITFMDSHPDAGATGVRMIDGKGRLLPESKRALPTPKTAFFKIVGLSYIFPKSRLFNRYYLGHLDNLQISQAEVISGAFMFLRGEAVAGTGLFDEDFFMYGEDIDYSYRLKKAGFNNYYYPEIKIIHYKGESTKKENLNVLINFYKAMRIFVRKHYTNGGLQPFVFLIQVAILLRAGLSLLNRFIKRVFLPLTDGFLAYCIFRLVTSIWENYKFGPGYAYPETFTNIIVPVYSVIILLSISFISGFRFPSKVSDSVKGVLAGIFLILILYALLPMDLRFSRAVIIIGGVVLVLVIPSFRFLVSLIMPEIADNPFSKARRTVIVSDPEGYAGVKDLILSAGDRNRIAGRVSIRKDDMKEDVLGNIEQIREVLRINRIKEVIFTTRGMNASQIIDSMHLISDFKITIKIASPDEKYILGSRYVNPKEGIIPSGRPQFKKKIFSRLKNFFR
jgi:GT2 family glycosyltransferase